MGGWTDGMMYSQINRDEMMDGQKYGTDKHRGIDRQTDRQAGRHRFIIDINLVTFGSTLRIFLSLLFLNSKPDEFSAIT